MNILNLPTWLNGIVIVGGSALLGVALVYGLDVFVKRRRGKKDSSVFSDGLQTIGTLYAVVAGFLYLRNVPRTPRLRRSLSRMS